jgi:hypothetical protein
MNGIFFECFLCLNTKFNDLYRSDSMLDKMARAASVITVPGPKMK